MKYAQIRSMDISNGEGIGCSLFVQGCHFHCKNCFNQDTWDFCSGKEWTKEIELKFFELIDRPYIKRITILGGEPLANENVHDVLKLIEKLKIKFPDKSIWIYTGYKWEQIFYPIVTDDLNSKRDQIIDYRINTVKMCDVIVDGRYIDEQRDLTLKWCGSRNQRVIDAQKSIKENKIVLYN